MILAATHHSNDCFHTGFLNLYHLINVHLVHTVHITLGHGKVFKQRQKRTCFKSMLAPISKNLSSPVNRLPTHMKSFQAERKKSGPLTVRSGSVCVISHVRQIKHEAYILHTEASAPTACINTFASK